MSLKTNLVRQFIRRLSPQDILDLAGEAVREWMARMPVEERAAFLSRLLEENLGAALQGLGREERAALMNGMLPVIARHFPLDEVDILGAFADFEPPQTPDWDGL
ncbi:MAG: hypothetical protein DRH12_13405 [Deltaproteobacteria bacterium]|nr:MAG: hypothetical protein DRH12_13405 [Deltaproteobacteria bacterium]